MKVKDLISKLKAFNPELDVMLDVTHPDSELFRFCSLKGCEQVTTSLNEEVIVISPPHGALNIEDEQDN